jgi:GNAT superfamily N-acetyltransferase
MNCTGCFCWGILVLVETKPPVGIWLLDPTASDNHDLVADLTSLINLVYAKAEQGLWRTGTPRTNPVELAGLIAAGEIAVAGRNGQLAGSIRIRDVSPDVAEFGLLVAAPSYRSTGVGRALVDFAEQSARERGMRAMQLELLVPKTWRHPSKEFLSAWYGRRGYRVIHTRSIHDAYPHLAPLLATPCDLVVYEKPLGVSGGSRSGSPR